MTDPCSFLSVSSVCKRVLPVLARKAVSMNVLVRRKAPTKLYMYEEEGVSAISYKKTLQHLYKAFTEESKPLTIVSNGVEKQVGGVALHMQAESKLLRSAKYWYVTLNGAE